MFNLSSDENERVNLENEVLGIFRRKNNSHIKKYLILFISSN